MWHSELADMAQGWADTCDFDHGQPAVTSPPYDPIGQNIYTQSGNTLNVVAILNAWFQEKAFYDYPTKTCQANQMCGHYTQVHIMYYMILYNKVLVVVEVNNFIRNTGTNKQQIK